MSDEQATKSTPFNARINETDKEFLDETLKAFPGKNQAERFQAFIEQYKKGLEIREPEKIQIELLPDQRIIDFTPEVLKKLRALRLWLKKEQQIPVESSEAEFLNGLIETLVTRHISQKFNFLNR